MEKKKSMFKEAVNETSHLKCEIYGFTGSGKTYTAGKIAIGLHAFTDSKKPVSFIDSEMGSDKLIDMFKENKIQLQVVKTKTFVEMSEACKEAKEISDILIIDSQSQYWKELVESYMDKIDIKYMNPKHWMLVKRIWNSDFAEFFLHSNLHIIACGRAGWVFKYVEDEDGTKQITATETKIKSEGEFGYEADLLIEMERIKEEYSKVGAKNIRRCWIQKDKWNSIDGRHFDNPTFENFLPYIEHLALKDKKGHSIDLKKSSQGMFQKGSGSGYERMKQRDIFLEEIENELTMKFPGRSDEMRQEKIKTLRKVFGTAAWAAIKDKQPEDLEAGLKEIRKIKTEKEEKK